MCEDVDSEMLSNIVTNYHSGFLSLYSRVLSLYWEHVCVLE
jgi:hypothetical protein